MSVKNKREKKNEDDAKKKERKTPPPPPPGRVGGASKGEVSPSEGPAKTPGRVATPQAGRATQPPRGEGVDDKSTTPPVNEPSVVLEEGIAKEAAAETVREKEGQAIKELLNKHDGKIENVIEKLNGTILDSGRRDAEFGRIAEMILENGYDKGWDDATAVIRAIDDHSTRAENLVKLAEKQKKAGKQDTVVKETLDEAVKSAKKDKEPDDSVKALIKVAETMAEFEMKPAATGILREAKGINQYKVKSKKLKKKNNSKIYQVAEDKELGEIKVPAYKKLWRYSKRTVAGTIGALAAAWLILEFTAAILGVTPRDLLVKAGIMKERQEEAAEKPKYASEEAFDILGGRVGVMGDILEIDSMNGYPTVMPPELMELRKKEKEHGEDYKTLSKEKTIEGIEGQLKKEKDKGKKLELENELNILKLGKRVEEAYNLEKMKFSTKPIPDILAELESAEKALGKDYATVKNETGEEETQEKQVLKLLILELGGKLDNRMKLEKFIFEEKIRRNVTAENYCGNTVVGVDTNKPDEYPTRNVCDIIKWNVVDGEGNLLEVTVYDDHISCPDDCKGKPGKKKKKEPEEERGKGSQAPTG